MRDCDSSVDSFVMRRRELCQNDKINQWERYSLVKYLHCLNRCSLIASICYGLLPTIVKMWKSTIQDCLYFSGGSVPGKQTKQQDKKAESCK